MKTKKTRLLCLILAFLLCVGVIPLSFLLVGADETATDYSDYIIANISFASADDLSGGGATATPVGDGMTYDDGESVTMTDGESYFTVAKDDGTALLEGLTEVTISFDANTTGDTSWAFEVTSEESHSFGAEHYIGCLINTSVLVERYSNEVSYRPAAAQASTTNNTWVHYDCVFFDDGCTAVYIDGELASMVEETDGFDLTLANCIGEDSVFRVGKANWVSGEFFSGSLKNLVVYSTAIYEHTDDSSDTSDDISVSGTEVTINTVIDDGNGTWAYSEDATSDHVFDGDTSTFYDGAIADAWVGCTIDSTVISTVALYARDDQYYYRMDGAEIQGSNDGETWTTLYTISEEENAQGEWVVCEITDTTAYTYLRVYGCDYGNVAEMKIYTAYAVTDGLVAYYALSEDLTDSVGSADGSLVYTPITNTAEVTETATYTDGALTIAEGSTYGVKFPVSGITSDFTVSVTIEVLASSRGWASPFIWIGGTDQSTENWIGLWTGFYSDSWVAVGSNDSEGHRLGVNGTVSSFPASEATYTIVVESNVAYLYINGVYVGQSNGTNGFTEIWGTEYDDITTSTMPNPWSADDCAIYIAANAWGDANVNATYSDLYVYNRALTADEVAEIATSAANYVDTSNWTALTTDDYAAYIDDGNGSWDSNEATTAEKAWDGDTSTYYDCENGSGGYTGVQLTTATAIEAVSVTARSGFAYRLEGALIQGSTDGTTWVDLYTLTDEDAAAAASGEVVCAIYDTTAYTYYRFYSSDEGYCNVAEVVLYTSYNFDDDTSNVCGDNLTWTLEDGTLTISGTGEMYDYDYGTAPWYSYCESITSVVIEDGAESIGEYAFWGCTSLESVTIPDSVTTIGDDAFAWCSSLESIIIPDSVTSIGEGAFWGCTSLTSVTIGDGVTTIGSNAFYNCTSLESVTIPDSVTEIGIGTFNGCRSLVSVTIPDSVTTIGSAAFASCTSLTSVTIPDSVTSIGSYAFERCTSLTSVTIGDGVTTIGSCA
ncbi:MAG: leucine-rich repeat protein, partial [Clostridia bacterium]|nr:leucine-rich repeat protein [Clostridia bacterium]